MLLHPPHTLTSLSLETDHGGDYRHYWRRRRFALSPEHITDVRSLSITQFNTDSLSASVHAELLAPPHSLQWTRLDLTTRCVLDLPTASLLRSLPFLTEMLIPWIPRGQFVDFLQFVPQLRSIEWSRLSDIDSQAGELMDALSQFPALTQLSLRDSAVIDAAMLTRLFAKLLNLRVLRLQELHNLSSLDWIPATPSLSLEELDLLDCPLIPASNLPLLLGLQSLCCLRIEDCSLIKLSDEERTAWTPPVRGMPRLREFSFWSWEPRVTEPFSWRVYNHTRALPSGPQYSLRF